MDSKGRDETQYLDPLREIVTTGKTNADIMLDHYNSDWDQDVRHLFKPISLLGWCDDALSC